MTNEHKWFYLGSDDIPQGPVDRDDLLEMVKLGHAREDALVWRDGFGGWRPFRDVGELTNPGAEPAAIETPVKQPSARPSRPAQPLTEQSTVARKLPKIERSHLALGLGFATVAIVIVSALYTYSGPVPADESSSRAILEQAEFPGSIEDFPEVDPGPIRVKNPFDASEIFEFPPGTSETDARDAVADLLMKRALERRSRKKAS